LKSPRRAWGGKPFVFGLFGNQVERFENGDARLHENLHYFAEHFEFGEGDPPFELDVQVQLYSGGNLFTLTPRQYSEYQENQEKLRILAKERFQKPIKDKRVMNIIFMLVVK